MHQFQFWSDHQTRRPARDETRPGFLPNEVSSDVPEPQTVCWPFRRSSFGHVHHADEDSVENVAVWPSVGCLTIEMALTRLHHVLWLVHHITENGSDVSRKTGVAKYQITLTAYRRARQLGSTLHVTANTNCIHLRGMISESGCCGLQMPTQILTKDPSKINYVLGCQPPSVTIRG